MKNLYKVLTVLLMLVVSALTVQAAGLDINSVTVNDQSVATSLSVRHIDQLYVLKFNITNTDNATNAVDYDIIVDNKVVSTSAIQSFAFNQTESYSVTLPALDLGARNVKIAAKIFGIVSKETSFTLNVGTPTQIQISSAAFDVSQLTCAAQDVNLAVSYRNYGSATDGTVKLVGAVNATKATATLPPNSLPLSDTFTFNSDQLKVGANTFNVVVEYGSGLKVTSNTLSLTKPSCVPSLQTSLSSLAVIQSDFGKNKTVSITLSNTGVGEVTGITASVPTGMTLSSLTGVTIASGSSVTATLTFTVPSSLAAGTTSLGKVNFTANGGLTSSVDVNVKYELPKSDLEVTQVKLNGKTDGDLKLNTDNTFKVTVNNDGTKDLEDVTVTVTIRNINDDNDDLDEESDSFDLDSGDDYTTSVTFDLAGEELTEEDYTVEFLVQGEDKSGKNYKTTYTQTFTVSREKHQVVIKNTDLSSTTLQCLKQTSLSVEIENIGKSDEEDVEVRIENSVLGLDLSKKNIDLDDYSGSDNTYEANFAIEVEDAKAGTYPLIIGVYRDGDLDDSVTINLEVKDCGSSSTSTGIYDTNTLTAQLQKQLQADLEAKKIADQNKVVSSNNFRDSNAYVGLMVGLIVVLVLAILLGIAVAAKKN